MRTCPKCGAENLPVVESCQKCGVGLAAEPIRPPIGPGNTQPLSPVGAGSPGPLAQTLLFQGLSPEDTHAAQGTPDAAPPPLADPPAQPPNPAPGFGQTLVIQQPNLTGQGTPNAKTALPALGRTMLGIAPSGTAKPDASAGGAPHAPVPLARTMLGIAPGPAPSFDGTAPVNPYSQTGSNEPPHRTIQGVAPPGIAPLRPGVPKSPPSDSNSTGEASPLATLGVSPDESQVSPGPRTLNLRAAKKSSRAGLAAIAIAVALVGLGVGAFFFFKGPGSIDARAVLDAEGREWLEVGCKRCTDGTEVWLDAAQGTFKDGIARIHPPQSLRVGDNTLKLSIKAPDSYRQHNVSLNVRIQFRVRTDLTQLNGPVPRLGVIVQAVPKSTVSIDDRPVQLRGDSTASLSFDVTRELTGLDSKVRPLERRIRYAVAPPGASSQAGELVIRLGITPLWIEAPGGAITLEDPKFMLAGQTGEGARVTVDDRLLPVDVEGRFAQAMLVSSIGETTITVRAAAPDQAPRLFPIRIRRVASLAQEAVKVRTRATTSYAVIANDPQSKRGWEIALEGSVLEQTNLGYSTLVLFEAVSGCRKPPCLSRVVYRRPTQLSAGERVSVFGRVTGAVEGPQKGALIPEVLADFILSERR